MVIDFPQSEPAKLRTTAHRIGDLTRNVQRLMNEVEQVSMDKIHEEFINNYRVGHNLPPLELK